MNKQSLITILLTVLMSVTGAKAFAHDIEVPNSDGVTIYYKWANETKTELAVSYRGLYSSSYSNEYTGNIVIPKSVEYDGNTYPVTSIGESAFYNCSDLTSVTIPNSVTSIGSHAFDYCLDLTSVLISDIKTWCNIDFFDSSSNPLYYAHHLYLDGEEITELIIPSSVTSIKKYAFYGCNSLTSINIPNSVIAIGTYAFSGCSSSLTSIMVESGNPKYDSRNNCNALIETSTNTLILGCNKTIIPNGVTSIEGNAFYECKDLTSVTIPNSVVSIGYSTFKDCSSLTSISIPNSVTSIGGGTTVGAFAGTAWYNNQPDGLVYAGKVAYSYKGEMPNNTQITIKYGTTEIADDAFSQCVGLTSITIPNSVTSIGAYAFRSCIGLTTIVIPNGVTSIGYSAFYNCGNLTSIIIPQSMKHIGQDVFRRCNGLNNVYCIADKVTTSNDGEGLYTYPYAFYNGGDDPDGLYKNLTLHVPSTSITAYKAIEPWKYFKAVVALTDDDIPTLPKCAKPTISYNNGTIDFTCSTAGVDFVSSVTSEDFKSYSTASITLSQKYTISVYAAKTGYDNSDVATMDIIITGNGQAYVVGDMDGDGKLNATDVVKLVDKIMGQ